MAPDKLEKCKKHVTFRTFEPKSKKSLVFWTLYDGQGDKNTGLLINFGSNV